jgi:hypothetical protein
VQVLGLEPQGAEPDLGRTAVSSREDGTAPDKPWKERPPQTSPGRRGHPTQEAPSGGG